MNSRCIIILMVISLFLITTVNGDYINFVVRYVKANNIKLMCFSTCWSNFEKIEITKRLHEDNIRTAFHSPKALVPGYLIIVDLACTNASTMAQFQTPSWILLLDYGETTNGLSIPEGNRVDAVVFQQEENRRSEMYETLRLMSGPVEIGGWNNSSGSSGLNSQPVKFWKNHLKSVVVLESVSVAATSERHFEDYMLDTRNRGQDSTLKFLYAVFKLLQNIHGFSHDMVLVEPNSRMEKLLYDEQIDIGISGKAMSTTKITMIDYAVPSSYYIRTCFLYKNPREYPILSMELLRLFANSTWTVFGLVSVAIVLCMKATYSIHVKFLDDPGEETSWSVAFFSVLCVICQESVPTCLSSTSCRLVVMSLLILSVLLYNYFTSIAVSVLMNSQPPFYKSLVDLADSDLEVAFDNQTYVTDWIESTAGRMGTDQKLYRTKLKNGKAKVYSPKYGMEKVKLEKMAYHVDATVGYELVSRTFTQEPICDLGEVQMIPPGTAGFLLRKNSPYRDLFQTSLRRMAETGITHRLKMIWQRDKPKCHLDTRVFPIGMDRAFGTLLFFIVGSVLAFLILGFEMLWKKFDHKSMANNHSHNHFIHHNKSW